MDIEVEKIELMKLLAETNDESIIASIKSIFKKEKKDFWDELTADSNIKLANQKLNTSVVNMFLLMNVLSRIYKNEEGSGNYAYSST